MDEQTAFILAQCVSVGTGVMAITLKQMKTMKMILLFEVITNLLASTNYLLMGGDAGAIVSVLAILNSLVMLAYNKRGSKPHISVIVAFNVAYVACSIYSLIAKSDAMEILPAIGAVCFSMTLVQRLPFRYRLWSVGNLLCWVIYDTYIASYVMLLVHLGILLSTVIAMIRVDGIFRFHKQIGTKTGVSDDEDTQ